MTKTLSTLFVRTYHLDGLKRELIHCQASMTKPTIQYTKVDEAPALATYSLLPIIKVSYGMHSLRAFMIVFMCVFVRACVDAS